MNPNYVRIERLRELRFAAERPGFAATLRAWARAGTLPGARKINRTWLVDLTAFDAAAQPAPAATITIKSLRERVAEIRGTAP